MEPINLHDYEKLAQAQMDPLSWDYYHGGSDDEVTVRENRAAFSRFYLRPRMFVDVSTCLLETTVLGTPVAMPVLVAPTAAHGLAHPDGERATAQGTGDAGTLFVASCHSTHCLEDIAEAATGPQWFQLYIRTPAQARRLVTRAQAAGYRAIVLTVDLPRLGNRERDLRNDFRSRPFPMANLEPEEIEESAVTDTLTWKTLDWLRTVTDLPILVKGILTAEDAHLALEHGAGGILVSNHGGRQLDGVIPAIEALPEIVAAVAGRCEVYVDGGIRRGTDVLKALALGARAVLVGRPVLWGLAVNGRAGVQHVLDILRVELDRAMALAGCPSVESVSPSLVRPAPR